jgi:enoyl-CoA hydratase
MAKMTYTFEDRIAVITFDDGKMNVINWDFINELNESLDRAIHDKAGALILTTGRPGIFSAGLDVKLLPTLSLMNHYRFSHAFAETMLRLYQFPIPTIAAYAGHAIAGGALMSFACDRFLAVDGPYRIQMNEVVNNMVLPSWIALICKSSIPHRWQREALLHARAYSPREAFDRQIIDTLLDVGDDAMEKAKAVAREFLKLNPRAYADTKDFLLREDVNRVLGIMEKEFMEVRERRGDS